VQNDTRTIQYQDIRLYYAPVVIHTSLYKQYDIQ
jgi:hypothetical protein